MYCACERTEPEISVQPMIVNDSQTTHAGLIGREVADHPRLVIRNRGAPHRVIDGLGGGAVDRTDAALQVGSAIDHGAPHPMRPVHQPAIAQAWATPAASV